MSPNECAVKALRRTPLSIDNLPQWVRPLSRQPPAAKLSNFRNAPTLKLRLQRAPGLGCAARAFSELGHLTAARWSCYGWRRQFSPSPPRRQPPAPHRPRNAAPAPRPRPPAPPSIPADYVRSRARAAAACQPRHHSPAASLPGPHSARPLSLAARCRPHEMRELGNCGCSAPWGWAARRGHYWRWAI